MAGEIGSVKATFTSSSSGLVSGVNASVASLRSLSSEQQVVQQTTSKTSAAYREAAKLTRELATPAEKYADTVAKLDSFLSRGMVTQEIYNRAVAKAQAEMKSAGGAVDKYAKAFDNAESYTRRFSETLSGASAAVESLASAGNSVVEFTSKVAAAFSVYKAYTFLTEKRLGSDSFLGILLGLGKTISLIRIAEYGFKAFGVEVDGVAGFATKATVAFAAFKLAAAAGLTSTASVTAFAASLNATYGITAGLTTGLTYLGVSAGTTTAAMTATGAAGSAVGGILARVAAMSLPGFGQLAAAAYFTGSAMLSARESAYGMAETVGALSQEAASLGVSLQDLQIQKAIDAGVARQDLIGLGASMSQLSLTSFDNLAVSMEKVAAEGKRSETVFASMGTTLSVPFVGLFAAVSEGAAGFTSGMTSLVSGILAVVDPIAQALAPFGTLIGTAVSAVMQLGGAVLDVAGIILQTFGAAISVPLAVVATGFANFADTIRSAVGGAFEWFSSKIEWLRSKLDGLYAYLAKVPVIGAAFKTNEGGVAETPKAAAGATEAATDGAKEQMKAAADAARAAEQEAKATESRAKAIKEGILTPYEKYTQALQEARDLEAKGLLTAEQRGKQEAKLLEQFQQQDPLQQEMRKKAEEIQQAEKKRRDQIEQTSKSMSDEIEKASTAGKELGSAADGIRGQFASAAQGIKASMEAGTLSPDEAKKQMAGAVDAMNEELKRLGDDIKFAEKIRNELKSAGEKVKDEMAAIDANKTLTDDEKTKAKDNLRDKAKASLPGGGEEDAVSKFRKQQQALRDALKNDLISKDEYASRTDEIKKDLESSAASKDKQEENKQSKALAVNSSEGVSTFFRLLQGGQANPSQRQLVESQKQTRLLQKVADVLAEQEVVNI
jgi:hypothetical protein